MEHYDKLKESMRECLKEMIEVDESPLLDTEHMINMAWNEILDEVLVYKEPHLKLVQGGKT